MSDLLSKCEVCGAVLDEEDLFCSECGTEAPLQKQSTAIATHRATHNFICKGCGASMSYDASKGTLRCPFCGSTALTSETDQKEIAPREIVPFAFSHEAAVERMRGWLASGFWRPSDLGEQAMVVAMQPVYVPYWVFAADTQTYWTGDSSQTPFGARGDWCPMSGEHAGHYDKVLVGTSSALTAAEMAALGDYDLSQAIEPDRIDLTNVTYERFKVARRYARPIAREGLEAQERAACAQYIPGRSRNVNVNVRITELTSYPVMMPVWIMAYRYREKVFRFLINGQSGQSTGNAPVSMTKIGVAILIGLVAVGIIVALSMAQ